MAIVTFDRKCEECGAKLSRYNTDDLCFPCQERQERVAEQITPANSPERASAGVAVVSFRGPKGMPENRLTSAGMDTGEHWCDGCQRTRHARAFRKDGTCSYCTPNAETGAVQSRGLATAPKKTGRPRGGPVDDWLREYLSSGGQTINAVREEAAQRGFVWNTIENARTRIGARSYYDQQQAAYVWCVGTEKDPAMMVQREKVTLERETITVPVSASTRTLKLHGGGTITVAVDADLFRLTAADRELVLGVVDALRAFEVGQPFPAFHHCACEHQKAMSVAAVEIGEAAGFCPGCSFSPDSDDMHEPDCAAALVSGAPRAAATPPTPAP